MKNRNGCHLLDQFAIIFKYLLAHMNAYTDMLSYCCHSAKQCLLKIPSLLDPFHHSCVALKCTCKHTLE